MRTRLRAFRMRGFFDNMDHEWTMKFVEHRVADNRILRLIRKWLKAGVSEDGEWSETKVGTPQGAVISPLLANVYLHYSPGSSRQCRFGLSASVISHLARALAFISRSISA